MLDRISRFLRSIVWLIGRPVRQSESRRGVVIQPYRGYGSRTEIFLIGRVFRQSDRPGARHRWDLRGQIRDVLRRLMRRAIPDAPVKARFCGADETARTDKDGYFRITLRPPDAVPDDIHWHRVELTLLEPERVEAYTEVFIPPPQARFAVISDIDDTVMFTGVANKAVMLWNLFVEGPRSRTAFPGVSALYRALHAGRSGRDANPMLYVSRAPWGLYEILETFFQIHDIPVGPILFLREWGITWKSPLPRKAKTHKRELIDAMMALYDTLPFVLIGDSGQHDPEAYREIVEQYGDRVKAVYIRDVSARNTERVAELKAMEEAVRAAGSHFMVAADSVAIAEDAAALGLVPDGATEMVRKQAAEEERGAASR